jgi:type II secretory pathway component PulM
MPKLIAKLVMIVVAVALVFALLWLKSCSDARRKSAESRLQRNQTEAVVDSAKDAIAAQGEAMKAERASEALTQSNEKEIRNAEGADARINPAAHRAGMLAICRRPGYRDSERCKLLLTSPAGVEARR